MGNRAPVTRAEPPIDGSILFCPGASVSHTAHGTQAVLSCVTALVPDAEAVAPPVGALSPSVVRGRSGGLAGPIPFCLGSAEGSQGTLW